jgi:hypothetical protein
MRPRTRSVLFIFLVLAITAVVAPAAQAAPGDTIWSHTWNTDPATTILMPRVVTCATGDVYVTASIDRGTGHGYDWMVSRYSAAGTRVWTRYFDGPAHGGDYVTALAADRAGNVVLCGNAVSSAAHGYDFTAVRFSRAGKLLWSRRTNGSANGPDVARDVVVDGAGNATVAGVVQRKTTGTDWLTVHYSPAGKLLWRRYCDGPAHGYDNAASLTRDAGGHLYVAGSVDGGPTRLADVRIIRFSASGHTDWTLNWGSANTNESVSDIAVSSYGIAWVGGMTSAGKQWGLLGSVDLSGHMAVAPFTDGYFDPAGTTCTTDCVAIDRFGDVAWAGDKMTSPAHGLDYYLAQSTAGFGPTPLLRNGTASSTDLVASICMSAGGIVYATGALTDTGTARNIYTVARYANGIQLWEQYYYGAGASADAGQSIALASDGVYVAGSRGSDLVLIKYVP